MKKLRAIPTNIITGFLGVGKTTAILNLMKQRPDGEKWAVLVNEFGKIGIDQAAMPESDGVAITELAGGCICCTMGVPLRVALTKLIREARPDRLIIEPTGLGHPTGILETLTSHYFAEVLDVRAIVTLVDPRCLEDQEIINSPIFQDQINLADVLVINKIDVAGEKLTEEIEINAGKMYPPKVEVIRTTQGEISCDLLDVDLNSLRNNLAAHKNVHEHGKNSSNKESVILEKGKSYRKIGEGMGFVSCGWVFHADDVFDENRLLPYLESLVGPKRLKGVFRLGKKWALINRIGSELTIGDIAYRRDSRLEIICKKAMDWDEIEQKLLTCML